MSVLSYGTWITFAEQDDPPNAAACLATAREAGMNFFDTAESYGNGVAERLLGATIDRLGWDRATFVLSTKLYWGIRDCVNMRQTLNRKYLLQAIDESLERLRTRFVDVVFCHRPDAETPVEETVWTMSDIIAAGKAHYWGTSAWPPEQIRAAYAIAEHYGLRKPTVEQPEYNLFVRRPVEAEYAPLSEELGLGLTTWSPLASGILTGKYLDGAPPTSRASLPGYDWLRPALTDAERNRRVLQFRDVAASIGCSPAQLAIAWCTMHPAVSSVITGASHPAQIRENVRALDVVPKLSQSVLRFLSGLFPAPIASGSTVD